MVVPPTARTTEDAGSYVTDRNVTRFILASGSYSEKSDTGYQQDRVFRVTAVNENRYILPSGRFSGKSDTNIHRQTKEAYKANPAARQPSFALSAPRLRLRLPWSQSFCALITNGKNLAFFSK